MGGSELVRVAARGKLRAQRGLSAGAAQRWCERSGMEMRGGKPFYKSVWVTERSLGSPRTAGGQISL